MKRVLILGSSGSGKSTLAKRVHEILQLPVIHMDAHYFAPNWVEPERKVWHERVKKLAAEEEWIMDGNYSSSLHLRLPRADTVIFLDFSRWKCLWRVLSRWVRFRGKVRPSAATGCEEKMDWEFFHYVLSYPNRSRSKVLRLLEKEKGRLEVNRLRNEREVEEFLENLKSVI